jgi:hypothetical protein
MLLLRDEEHVGRWCAQRGLPRGALLSPEQLWGLAKAWYERRLAPDWRRRTPDEAQEVFESLGLTGDFWRLQHPLGPRGG